ncbi:tetratricopeptide repeat protein [Glycomyces terrestris]|nr:tetratricopeptide repeat protein [Glycomyces terrestris]
MVTARLDRDIDRKLAAMLPKPGARRSQPRYVLSGMGGVGKTQMAAALANRLWRSRKVDLLVWVTAETRKSILSALAQANADITGMESHDPEQGARQFLAWLATPSTRLRWLIVFDDLAKASDLQGLWPPESKRGATVVTTRRRDLQVPADQHVIIDSFSVDEANAFLSQRLGANPERLIGAAELAADLGYLPFALAQAAAFIANDHIGTLSGRALGGEDRFHLMSCEDYRRALADRQNRLADLLPSPDTSTDDYNRSLATTWSISIDLANTYYPEGAAELLLQIASVLDPNGIPSKLFTSQVVRTWLNLQSSTPVTDVAIESLLKQLHGLNLLDFDRGQVRLHALAQHAIRDQLTNEQLAKAARTAADGLLETWPRTGFINGSVLQTNVLALFGHAKSALISDRAHPILFHAALGYRERDPASASQRYQQSLARDCQELLGPDHPDTLTARREHLNATGIAGEANTAAQGYTTLIQDYLRVLGANHADTLEAQHYLGFWTAETGNLATAIEILEHVTKARQRVLGPDHTDTLDSRRCLADVRGRAGKTEAAIAEFDAVLSDQQRVFGPDHPNTLQLRHHLAQLHGRAGNPEEAIAEFESILSDQQRVFGPDHPDTLDTLHNLAHLRERTGDTKGAITEIETVLAGEQYVLGPDHPDTLRTSRCLADLRGKSGDTISAIAEIEAVLSDQQRVFGPNHPDVFRTRHNLAHLRANAGNVPGAIAEFESVLSDQQRILGPDHHGTLETRHCLAELRVVAKDAPGAVVEFQAVVADKQRMLGPDHPDVLHTRHNLADLRVWAEDSLGAIAEFEAVLSDQQRVLGPDHPSTLETRHCLAKHRAEIGDTEGAVAEFEANLSDQQRVFGPDHTDTLDTRHNLAHLRGRNGDIQGTISELEGIVADQQRVLGPDHPETLKTRRCLANSRASSGNLNAAKVALLQLKNQCRQALGPRHSITLSVQQSLDYLLKHQARRKKRRRLQLIGRTVWDRKYPG